MAGYQRATKVDMTPAAELSITDAKLIGVLHADDCCVASVLLFVLATLDPETELLPKDCNASWDNNTLEHQEHHRYEEINISPGRDVLPQLVVPGTRRMYLPRYHTNLIVVQNSIHRRHRHGLLLWRGPGPCYSLLMLQSTSPNLVKFDQRRHLRTSYNTNQISYTCD